MLNKSLIIISIFLLYFTTITLYAKINTNLIKEGDIIFQETRSEQARAIKFATHSRYTHVGIIFKYNNQFKVLEAVQPVRLTNLETFINRGVDRHYVIKRLKNYDLIISKSIIERMKIIGNGYIGKNYDIYFEWSDTKLYCTELVWKIYKKSLNIEIGELEKLKDFDLSNHYVKKLMNKRYGTNIPYNESVISPESMFKSDNLMTIIDN